MVTKKEVSKLLKTKGKVRGNVLNTDAKYITFKYGKEGLGKLEKEIKKTGVEIKYEKVKNTDWYPIGYRAISLIVIKETFDWGDEELFEMGKAAPKNSFIVRTVLKYFVSLEKTFNELDKYWDKHYSIGKLETKRIDLKRKFLEFYIKDFMVHPCLCIYFKGYFSSIAEMILRNDDIKVEEPKCSFKGAPYHKFVITWK